MARTTTVFGTQFREKSITVRGNALPTGRRITRSIAEWLLFGTLAIASTYPLLAQAGTHLPQVGHRPTTVPLLNLWTLWWNIDRIDHAYPDYWNAPIYHGVPGIFASSEPQTIVGWLAWPLWKTLPSSVHVYNLLILVFLTLNGWSAAQFLRRLRLAWPATICGGAMITLLPLVHWQLGVFQLVSLWGVIWTLRALLLLQRHAGPRQALELGVAFAVTYSLCCYYGLFLSILLLACAPLLLGRALSHKRTWGWGAVAVVVAFTLLSPILVAQIDYANEHSFQYPAKWFSDLSAAPTDYLRTPSAQLVTLPDIHTSNAHYRWPLSPGTLKMGMACIGLGLSIVSFRRRRIVLMLGGMVAVAILLSMGPRLSWGAVSLHAILADVYPGFGHARNLFRFAFFAQLGIAFLAAVGLHEVYVRLHRRARPGKETRTLLAATLLVGLTLACEAWPQPPTMYRLPAVSSDDAWISWLRDQRQAEVCLACFPLPQDRSAAGSQPTAEWMYYQTFHTRPMVNGYSTFVPAAIRRLHGQLEGFPDMRGVHALRETGVTHVLFDRRIGRAPDRSTLEALQMTQVVNDLKADIEVWKLPDS